jgi:hypothetical protein
MVIPSVVRVSPPTGDFGNYCGYRKGFLGRVYFVPDSDFGPFHRLADFGLTCWNMRLCLSFRHASLPSITSTLFNKSDASLSVWNYELNKALYTDIE